MNAKGHKIDSIYMSGMSISSSIFFHTSELCRITRRHIPSLPALTSEVFTFTPAAINYHAALSSQLPVVAER